MSLLVYIARCVKLWTPIHLFEAIYMMTRNIISCRYKAAIVKFR